MSLSQTVSFQRNFIWPSNLKWTSNDSILFLYYVIDILRIQYHLSKYVKVIILLTDCYTKHVLLYSWHMCFLQYVECGKKMLIKKAYFKKTFEAIRKIWSQPYSLSLLLPSPPWSCHTSQGAWHVHTVGAPFWESRLHLCAINMHLSVRLQTVHPWERGPGQAMEAGPGAVGLGIWSPWGPEREPTNSVWAHSPHSGGY